MAVEFGAQAGRVRYTETAATRYQHRKTSKHTAEMALVQRALSRVPTGTMLDIPCGGGRVSIVMSKLGYAVTAADLSPSMVRIAGEATRAANIPVPVHERDLQALDYPPESFDAAICFRLFHHFSDPNIRARTVAELCRVARRHVLISYFSPFSVTAAKRILQERLFGKARKKYHTPLSEVAAYFARHRFRLVHDYAQLRFIRTLHLALFEREP